MSSYEAAQARLADAKRRRDTRSEHAAIADSKRLMTQVLREKFPAKAEQQAPAPQPKRKGRLTSYFERLIGGAL